VATTGNPSEPAPSPALRQHAEDLARGSEIFAELPEPDRDWVLEHAMRSYNKGLVTEADLAQHIHELASVRRFAVLERTETLMPQPPSGAPQ
jgi:hypothetical protein